MSRTPRDHNAEAAAITAAAERLLAGTPLRSITGKLTATELIVESGIARDKVYEHKPLVEQFQANVRAQHHTPTAMRQLTEEHDRVVAKLASTTADLVAERNKSRLLRLHIGELSLELDHARTELAAIQQIPRFDRARAGQGVR